MRIFLTGSFILLIITLFSCKGVEGKNEFIPVPEEVVPDSAKPGGPLPQKYDQFAPDWQKKQHVDQLLKELAAAGWQQREKAQKRLLELLLASENGMLDYLITRSLLQDDPEIIFRSKKVLQDYFYKTEYDPDRKKGFIGLQLMEAGEMVINQEKFFPIRVVMPQEGFPGKAADIRRGDLILGVDGQICGHNFSMNDFILYIASLKPGTEINLALFSLGKVENKKIKLVARPENIQSPAPEKSKKELFETWYQRKLSEIKQKQTKNLD